MPVLPDVGSTRTVDRLEAARGFERVDHGDADAILDRGQRIEELELHQDLGLGAGGAGDPRQPHQWGVADRLGDAVVDAATAELADRFKCLDLRHIVHGDGASRVGAVAPAACGQHARAYGDRSRQRATRTHEKSASCGDIEGRRRALRSKVAYSDLLFCRDLVRGRAPAFVRGRDLHASRAEAAGAAYE